MRNLNKYLHIPFVNEYNDMLHLDKSQSTIDLYSGAISNFFEFIDVKDVEDIKKIVPAQCRAFQKKSMDIDGLSPASVNSYGRALKAFFSWMYKNEYIENNPWDKVNNVKQAKLQKAYLTNDEIDAIINACKNIEEKTIVYFLLYLGVRKSELLNIKINDIHDDEIVIFGKGQKARTLYLCDDVKNLLDKYLKNRKHPESEYLFNKMGRRYASNAIFRKIKAIAKRAKISDDRIDVISPHTFRRTIATNLLDNGIDIRIIQGIMGHANISTTTLYAGIKSTAIERAMKGQGNE